MYWHWKRQFKTSSTSAALSRGRLQCSVQCCKEAMPFGGTFCPEEWSYAGFISVSPGSSVTSRAHCAKTSVPATELGSVRTRCQKRKIPRQIGKEAIPLAVYMQSLQVASWSSQERRIQHILSFLLWEAGLPAAGQRAWWHRMGRARSGPCAAHLAGLLL